MGLFLADQELNGDRATFTRQNPDGNNRRGFECPEERDYYPYWQYSSWVDIVVMTTNVDRCPMYQAESQNVKPRGYCQKIGEEQNMLPWMYIEESSCTAAGFTWFVGDVTYPESTSWGVSAPPCIESPWTRDNNLGNARATNAGGIYYSGIDNPIYNWTVPRVDDIATIFADPKFGGVLAAANCVLRVRYNVSTTDYDGWNTDASSNGMMYSNIVNDPWADYGWNYLLRLAMDTTQFSRVFEDRSHIFGIIRRPASMTTYSRVGGQANSGVKRQTTPYSWTPNTYTFSGQQSEKIHNLNVVGRRGSLVQAYPAEQYGFRPRILVVKAGDFIHPQWCGSFAATVDAWGEGATSTDEHNLVQIHTLKDNWPVNFTAGEQSLFETNTAWNLMFSGIYNVDGSENTPVLSSLSQRPNVCATLAQLQDQHGNINYEEIRTDQFNCAKLSGLAKPYFDAGLIQMNNPGTYYAADIRNNVPGIQSVKLTIVVEPL